MSRRWRLTPARRSLPPEAISLFWVFKSTPSPALEMYSSCAQSSVTVPETLSRNACAAGHCAASSRPAIATAPPGPKSIVSIFFSRGFSEADAARPGLGRMPVLDRVHHPAHEMDAEPAGLALFERQVDVRVGRARDVEGLGIGIGERHLDAAGDAAHVDAHRALARAPVLDHVRKKFLQHEIDRAPQLG